MSGARGRMVHMMRAPAAERNKDVILKVLKEHIPTCDGKLTALEVASGTGQHTAHFAEHLPDVTWQPSECDQASLKSISGYVAAGRLNNVLPPVYIDASYPPEQWAEGTLKPGSFDFIININMIHISEWAVTKGLFKAVNYLLKPGGQLFTYGPYRVNGVLEPESNVRFDSTLKSQNPDWGIRDTVDLQNLAVENSLQFIKMVDMPANNKILVFTKQ
ncbi:unnamed protein product [Owenia fusiformis]|uniref:Uncharacterized protein n=1 Tax=Owenia fusiformis TaxID=6347 RepID=A0A8J1UMG5_OWEFU|nr:unnamed protein product [Owenia fusiformis]